MVVERYAGHDEPANLTLCEEPEEFLFAQPGSLQTVESNDLSPIRFIMPIYH